MTLTTKAVILGAVLGFLGAVGVYFDPGEPYPGFITVAGTLFGVTVALLITTVVTRESAVPASIAWGALVALLPALAVFFAKGGWASWDAPYVVPTAVVTGAILGPAVRWIDKRRADPRTE